MAELKITHWVALNVSGDRKLNRLRDMVPKHAVLPLSFWSAAFPAVCAAPPAWSEYAPREPAYPATRVRGIHHFWCVRELDHQRQVDADPQLVMA